MKRKAGRLQSAKISVIASAATGYDAHRVEDGGWRIEDGQKRCASGVEATKAVEESVLGLLEPRLVWRREG